MEISKAGAIVTGGASGLGFATAQHLLKLGAKVSIWDLPTDRNEKNLAQFSEKFLFCPTDISQSSNIEKSLRQTVEDLGAPRILVNCAGVAWAKKILSKGKAADLKIFAQTIGVNLVGTYDVCRLVSEQLASNAPDQDNQRGVIINTASIAAFDGQMGQTAYAASKGGIASLTLPLARDLAEHGIRVVTIAPGIFDTPMLGQLPEAARQSLENQIPFPKRLGKPEEFAFLVQHIVENTMINGETIRLDGALRMSAR